MAGITLEQAQTTLNAYLAAEIAVLSGQRYEIAGRVLWKADIEFIQKGIETWNTRVQQLSRRSSRRSPATTIVFNR